MIRKLPLLISILLLSMAVSAQTVIGFTNETSNRDNNFRLSTNTDQRLAVRFDAQKLQYLKGSTIKAIRMAVGSKQSTGNTATLFLSTALDEEPITTEEVTLTSTNKFVEYELSSPYTITGDEDALFVGVKMTIAASYGPFSADGSHDMKNVAFAYGKNGWEDLYGHDYGMPNIEIILDETVDFCASVLKNFSEDGYMKVDTPFTRTYELFNFGTTTINDFDLNVNIGGEEKIYNFENVNIEPRQTYDFTLEDLKATKTGQQQITLSVDDDEVAADVYFYPQDMEKSVLVELFTGQTCTNCPTGHSSLATALSRSGVKAVEIAHHSGYVSDIFTMKEDWTVTSLYNGTTYAPAAMVNRTVFNEASSPVFDPQSISGTTTKLTEADTQKPYVSLAMDAQYDEATRMVTLKARVYPHETMPGEDIRYSLWLTQDNIVAPQANGTETYVHNAVSRGCLTESAWGETLNYTPGKEVVITKTFELPEEIVSTSYEKTDEKNRIATVLKDMNIVMFVHQQSSNNVAACQVFNAAECGIGESIQQGGFPVAKERKLLRQTYYGDTQGYEESNVATRTLDYLYDSQNNLVRVIETSKDTGLDSWQLTHYKKYDYDADGNMTMQHSLMYGQFDYGDLGFRAANDTIRYEYNEKGQLVKEIHPLKYLVYAYDDEGQMLTRSTWKVNSITYKASNDLLETFYDFNDFGKPEKVVATSPTGKSWNEYTAVLEYDIDGNLVSEVHYDADGVRKYAEYWSYENGMLVSHELPTVYDDGTELENEKEVYTPVDGNMNRISHVVYLHNSDNEWDIMAGTNCIDEYAEITKGESPEISISVDETAINTASLEIKLPEEGTATLYRNGICIAETNGGEYTDQDVQNGTYEYVAVQNGKASNIVTQTYYVYLPAVENLHGASTRKDVFGTRYVTLAWENPEYDTNLGFIRNDVFIENMQQPDITTDDATATSIEMEYGTDLTRNVFVQTVYKYGRANTKVVTVDLAEVEAGIEYVNSLGNAPVKVYNLEGKCVLSGSAQQATQLNKGVYIMQIEGKFMKVRL